MEVAVYGHFGFALLLIPTAAADYLEYERFLLIDAIWLGLVAPKFYKAQIGHLMSEKPNFVAALIFYLIFIVGVVYFVVNPAVEAQSMTKVLVAGALFGVMTYATYDLTNLATLKDWPIKVTIIAIKMVAQRAIANCFFGEQLGLITFTYKS